MSENMNGAGVNKVMEKKDNLERKATVFLRELIEDFSFETGYAVRNVSVNLEHFDGACIRSDTEFPLSEYNCISNVNIKISRNEPKP